ncbi:hypothetical protein GF386_00310 [Candidatus Pacearchaeota archaeon]|nr:hypothetical protein [Candidatus Pacearchaeota archaeon]MBD3282725.1 hypothetical protein [Candidatus Pacearchaeota archaeon]
MSLIIMEPDVLKTRDEILEAILYSCASNPFLRENLVFQGGGALHFVYGSPRYSNDLDFVCPDLPDLEKKICEILTRGIKVRDRNIAPALKTPDKQIRASYSLQRGLPAGKLEIYHQKSFEPVETQGKFSPLKVETPSEIYADKIAATLGRMQRRDSIKPTDLFDLEYILSNLHRNASLNDVQAKMTSYEEGKINAESLQRIIDYIKNPENHPGFRTAFKRTLMPDVYKSMELNAEYFEALSFHFERLLNQLPA